MNKRGDARNRHALESTFLKLPPSVIEQVKLDALSQPVAAPDPANVILCESDVDIDAKLFKRPKWRYDMNKTSVLKNETALFAKYLQATDAAIASSTPALSSALDDLDADPNIPGPSHLLLDDPLLRRHSFYERNLDTFRELWRAVEKSHVILILLDVRCPLLHYPRSLRDFVRTSRPWKPCILLLTKVDCVDEETPQRWKAYLEDLEAREVEQEHKRATVVCLQNYVVKPRTASEQGTRQTHLSGQLPDQRSALIQAIKAAHAQLCAPPPHILSNPTKHAAWTPPASIPSPTDIDWTDLEQVDVPTTASTYVATHAWNRSREKKARRANAETMGKAEARKQRRMTQRERVEQGQPDDDDDGDEDRDQTVPAQDQDQGTKAGLSLCLIGSPNVGKSSLLNALFGRKVVQASQTPGKTKHFQSLYFKPRGLRTGKSLIQLIDVPGLVCPSSVGCFYQVLAGVIPIQLAEATIAWLSRLLPLQALFDHLSPPSSVTNDNLDKDAMPRTYTLTNRQGTFSKAVSATHTDMTIEHVLTRFAVKHSLYTSKAGRPDLSRAAMMVLKAMRSGSVAWRFLPPRSTSTPNDDNVDDDGDHDEEEIAKHGIWLPHKMIGTETLTLEAPVPVQEESVSSPEESSEEEESTWRPQPRPLAASFASLGLLEDDVSS